MYHSSKLSPDEMRELRNNYVEMIADYQAHHPIWKIVSVTDYSERTEYEMDDIFFSEEDAHKAVDYYYEQQTAHYTTYRIVRYGVGGYLQEHTVKPPKTSNAVSVNALVKYIDLLQDFIESVDLFRDNEKLAPKYGRLKAQAGYLKRNIKDQPKTIGPNKEQLTHLGKIGE